MKTIISILVLILGTASVLITRDVKEEHRTCSCSGTFCSCDVTCLDSGEMPGCTCGTFSCICKCTPKDATNAKPNLPTMSGDQQDNSIKGEKYFRELKYPDAITIADGIKNLREAILKNDLNRYISNADVVEATFQKISASQKSAWEVWSGQNLKK